MKPNAIIFDLGKVLVDFDYGIAARKIAARCPDGLCDVRQLIEASPLLYRYETGLLTTDLFFAEVRRASGFAGDQAEFGKMFADIFSPIEPMIELQAAFRAQGIPTYIFSNTNELAVRHIRARFPFFSNFTGYVLSYEHGSMKPDARIYEVVERVTGHRGDGIVYLDDRPENIAGGAVRGWRTILYETPERSRQALQEMGMLPDSLTER